MFSPREVIRLLQNSVRNRVGAKLLMLDDQVRQSRVAKKFSVGALCVADSVRMEHDNVARIEDKNALIVSRLREHAKRKANEPYFFAFAAVQQQGLLLPRIRDT